MWLQNLQNKIRKKIILYYIENLEREKRKKERKVEERKNSFYFLLKFVNALVSLFIFIFFLKKNFLSL